MLIVLNIPVFSRLISNLKICFLGKYDNAVFYILGGIVHLSAYNIQQNIVNIKKCYICWRGGESVYQ